MKHWLFALATLASIPALAAAPVKPVSDQDQIKGVVESFRVAIINKDKASFQKLFFNDKPTWMGVISDKSLKLLKDRKTDPNQPDPAKVLADDDPIKFMDGMITNVQRHFEEKISNVHVDTDGNIGVVYFDYSFNVDGNKANWGKGSWHLVHTTDGWKISSVIWSMDVNLDPPKDK